MKQISATLLVISAVALCKFFPGGNGEHVLGAGIMLVFALAILSTSNK